MCPDEKAAIKFSYIAHCVCVCVVCVLCVCCVCVVCVLCVCVCCVCVCQLLATM